MPLSLRWIDRSDWDLLARVRMQCYSPASRDLEQIAARLQADPRNHDGADFLIAEQDGMAVGTSTALPLSLWIRGGRVPCQGVAWVGTIKTHRRRSRESGDAGIATRMMQETLRRAREREQVVSALMPFRASFYEHFGYGFAERRQDWTVPVSICPAGAFDGVRFYEPGDFDALVACRQRIAERGQCDIERSPELWKLYIERSADGFVIVDRSRADGPVQGMLEVRHAHEQGKDVLRVSELFYESIANLTRLLHFLASLKDQYASATLSLPGDLPLNRLLRETQIPHRPVNHPAAEVRPYTRMQIRVLDHKRLIESMQLPPEVRGKVTVDVHEAEGHVSKLLIEIEAGRAMVSLGSGDADLSCPDVTWASIVTGDASATTAVALGSASAAQRAAAEVLDVFARGRAPFCGEYF